MAAINTVDDLIEVLKRDGKVRSAVRREILTEDLLAVPARVDSVQETQTEMLAQITALREDFGSMQKAQDGMLAEIRSLREDFGSMQKTQDGVLTEIRDLKEGQRGAAEHRDILHRRYRKEHDAMHRFRGNYAIDAARKNRVAIAEEFAQLENLTDIDVEVLDEARLREMRNKNQEALVALGISAKERNSFHTADLALEVARIGEDSRPEYYIAVEASYTGTSDDIEHAAVRARMLGAITGCKAYAVVAAVKPNRGLEGRVIRDAGKYVASDDGSAAFWYQIADKELEPRPPR